MILKISWPENINYPSGVVRLKKNVLISYFIRMIWNFYCFYGSRYVAHKKKYNCGFDSKKLNGHKK